MAKVMISIPDDLLVELDFEARRQGTSRSGLLQRAARREIGLGTTDRDVILARLKEIASHWKGSDDSAEMVRRDRMRDEKQ